MSKFVVDKGHTAAVNTRTRSSTHTHTHTHTHTEHYNQQIHISPLSPAGFTNPLLQSHQQSFHRKLSYFRQDWKVCPVAKMAQAIQTQLPMTPVIQWESSTCLIAEPSCTTNPSVKESNSSSKTLAYWHSHRKSSNHSNLIGMTQVFSSLEITGVLSSYRAAPSLSEGREQRDKEHPRWKGEVHTSPPTFFGWKGNQRWG